MSQLARRIDRSESQCWYYFQADGRQPQTDILGLLAGALDVNPGELFELVDEG